jgi:glycosyltransferase involved in cell wall biosynthesis
MRVGFVLTQSRGGPVDATVTLARALAGRGVVEPVVLGPPPETSAGRLEDLWLDVRMTRKTDLPGARRIVGRSRQAGCDLLHAQDRRAILAVSRLAPPRVPTVGTYHGVPVECIGPTGRVGRSDGGRARVALRLDRWSLAGLSTVVTPSDDMARYLRSEVGVAPGQVAVVPNAVVPASTVGPVTGVRTFISVGSFTANKAVDVLVRAFDRVAERAPDVELVLVGDGPERAPCEALARRLGVADRVRFLGHRSDVPALVAAADVFVLPSREENAPLALLEAMAAGRACIASAVGGIPELLPTGTGTLVPPGDVSALTRAMSACYDRPAWAAELGDAAAARVAERHDVDEVAATYEALYARVRASR